MEHYEEIAVRMLAWQRANRDKQKAIRARFEARKAEREYADSTRFNDIGLVFDLETMRGNAIRAVA